MKDKVTFIGSGNVAWHLTHLLHKAGYIVLEIISRNIEHARELALKCNAKASNDFTSIHPETELCIISVSDDAIKTITQHIPREDFTIVHTSGSTDMNLLSEFKHYGVLYPLQSLIRNSELTNGQIPLCIEASDEITKAKLTDLSKSIASDYYFLNSEDRLLAHIAAVFASNFTNHMYSIAKEIMDEKNLTFNLFKPLILQTTKRIETSEPQLCQTGPAYRGDINVINKHLSKLKNKPDYQKIYTLVSQSISNHHKQSHD